MCLPRTDLSCRQALKKDRWKNGLKQREGEESEDRCAGREGCGYRLMVGKSEKR